MSTSRQLQTNYDSKHIKKQVVTARFILCDLDEQTQEEIKETIYHVNIMYAYVVQWCNDNHCVSRKITQHEVYPILSRYAQENNVPSAYVQAARDDARFNVKSWNSNHPDKKWQLDATRSKYASISLDARTITLRPDSQKITVSKIGKRFISQLNLDDNKWFYDKYDIDPRTKITAGRLGIKKDKNGKTVYYVVFNYKIPRPPLTILEKLKNGETPIIVGVDRGERNPLYASNGYVTNNDSRKHREEVLARYKKNESDLKAKGTRSAKRKLRKVSGRRARFSRDWTRCEANEFLNNATSNNVDALAFEDLTGLKKDSQKKFFKTKKHNENMNQFDYRRMLDEILLRCNMKGIYVGDVNPMYTSQTCSQCGHVDPDSRKGDHFHCINCDYDADPDDNASNVISQKYQTLLYSGGDTTLSRLL